MGIFISPASADKNSAVSPTENCVLHGNISLTEDCNWTAADGTPIVENGKYLFAKKPTLALDITTTSAKFSACLYYHLIYNSNYTKYNADELGFTMNFDIDWGDGSELTHYDSSLSVTYKDFQHVYADAGDYTITVTGICKWFPGYTSDTSNRYGYDLRTVLKRVYLPNRVSPVRFGYPGVYQGALLTEWDPNIFNQQFMPNGILNTDNFDYGSRIYNITDGFRMSGLTSIPANLFDFCTGISPLFRINFHSFFYSCASITSVPENLFDKLSNDYFSAENFEYVFYNCEGITSNLPPLWERFKSFTWSTASHRPFYGCTNAANYADAQAAKWA